MISQTILPVPKLGDPIVDTAGNPGVASFNPNTSAPLTAGDVYKGIASLPSPDQGVSTPRTYNAGGNLINEDTGEIIGPAAPDPESIRASVLNNFQKEIDATNMIYGQKMAEAKQQGISSLGSTRAIQAARGELGTDAGEAQKGKVVQQNNDIQSGIAAEQEAKIAAIMGQARTDTANEIAAKTAASKAGLDSYIQNLQQKPARTAANLQKLAVAMLTNGTAPSTIGDANLAQLASSYGVHPGDIISAYNSAKAQSDSDSQKASIDTEKTQAEIDQINQNIAKGKLVPIGDGTMLYNTETGEKIENPKNFAPKTISTTSSNGNSSDYDASTYPGGVAPSGPALKPLTEAQSKDLTYANRAGISNGIINKLQNDIAGMNSLVYNAQVGLEDSSTLSPFASATIKQYKQAQRDFLTSILRRESGASISPSEFDTAEKQYFPRPGDDAQTIAQKANLRATAISSFQSNVPEYTARTSQETPSNSQAIPKGTDGSSYGFPGYVSDGTQWIAK